LGFAHADHLRRRVNATQFASLLDKIGGQCLGLKQEFLFIDRPAPTNTGQQKLPPESD
jgi:hypothetical protein